MSWRINVFGVRGYYHAQSLLGLVGAGIGIAAFVWVWRRTR